MVSVDHFGHELRAQLRIATEQGASYILIISTELCSSVRAGGTSAEACIEAMEHEFKHGDVCSEKKQRLGIHSAVSVAGFRPASRRRSMTQLPTEAAPRSQAACLAERRFRYDGAARFVIVGSKQSQSALAETPLYSCINALYRNVSAFCYQGPSRESPTLISRNMVFNGT
jgi:hypothetical protein